MGAAAPFIAIAGTIISAGSQIMSGIQQSNEASANAQIAKNNAELAEQQAAADAAKQKRDSEATRSAKIAALSANNISINDSGSAWESLINDAKLAELDRLNILRSGKNTATIYRNQANMDKSKASSSLIGGIVGGLGSGASSAYNAYSDGAFDEWGLGKSTSDPYRSADRGN